MNDVNEESEPDVRFIRLKTGDDIVSEVVELSENDTTTLMLIDPLKIVYMAGGGKSFMQVAFMPWVFKTICDKQEFYIDVKDVLFMSNVSDNMNEYYWQFIDSYAAAQNIESEFERLEPDQEEDQDPSQEDIDNLREIVESLAGSKRTYH